MTIGIENSTGADGLQVVYNENYVQNGLAIEIIPVIDWVTVLPEGGIIPQGETQQITISVATADLELGEYLCDLILTSNDPETSYLVLPLQLVLTEFYLAAPDNLSITVYDGRVYLDWDDVAQAESYTVYGSNDPDLPFGNWTLLQAGITESNAEFTLTENLRFFKIVSIRNL